MLRSVVRSGALARSMCQRENQLVVRQLTGKSAGLSVNRLISTTGDNKDEHKSGDQQIPDNSKLQYVQDTLTDNLPHFFRRMHDFRIYREDVIFEDNIRKRYTKGLKPYAWQLAMVKMGAHMKYGKVNMQLLKVTSHPEDNTVRVRWRVVTFPGNNIFIFTFWRFRLWKAREEIEASRDGWIDGFSIFHCDDDGKVYKHVVDKVIPDQNLAVEKNKDGLAMKVALAFGLVTGESVGRLADGFDFVKEIISNLL